MRLVCSHFLNIDVRTNLKPVLEWSGPGQSGGTFKIKIMPKIKLCPRCEINQIEIIQRAFTKHITGMYDLPYTKRLKMLNLNSLHRRRERYCIIYLWKILESLVPNFSDTIVCSFSDRRGRSCIVSHVNPGRQGTLAFNSFRWRSIRIFNRLPIHSVYRIRNISACSIDRFKSQLDRYLRTIPYLPSQPGHNNSLDGRDGIQRWTLRDGLAVE